MNTLHELRKVGGFADLEGLRTEGSAIQIPKRRAHPTLLLEIIETMILAKTDPQNPLLLSRLDEGQAFDQTLENSLKLLDVNRELEAEIQRVLRLMQIVKRLYMGLNFILARSGRLKVVKVDSTASPTPLIPHLDEHMKISDRLDVYREYVSRLIPQVHSLLEMIKVDSQRIPGFEVESDGGDNGDDSPLSSLPDPLVINLKDPVDSTSKNDNPLDKYLQRAIRAARIAQSVENYSSDLLSVVKKLYSNLELAYAQCAVLISSRAMIA